jgi:DNA transformation protein and related proteins
MGKLSDLPNIGQELEKKLMRVGINSPGELRMEGSTSAFLKLSAIDPTACINSLYALEGAIQGLRWHELDHLKKTELSQFFKMIRNK